MLAALVQSLRSPLSLSKLRLATSCLLAFAAFLHYDKMAWLRCRDITISDVAMHVHILSSKTDQYRRGDTVLVTRKFSPTCPVSIMEMYFSHAGLSHSSSLLLFHGITRTKHGEQLRSAGGLSYTHMRELFIAKWREQGFDTAQFGLQILRAGGVPAAANASVLDCLSSIVVGGSLRQQRMGILRIRKRHYCPSPGISTCESVSLYHSFGNSSAL